MSTDKQGRSGLGLEAQREAVTRYLNGGKWTLAAEYVETESGKRDDRPKLAAALAHAKAIGATVVFAKLDRLTRSVDLLRTLVASVVDLALDGFNGFRKTDEHAINLRSIVEDIRHQGIISVRKMAEELNRRGILTPRGGEWQPTTVVRLLARLSV